jgi:hypothetical protein
MRQRPGGSSLAAALNALLHCIDNLVAQTAETLRRLDAKAT